MITLYLLIFAILSDVLNASCLNNWVEKNGYCYKLFSDEITTWSSAEYRCQQYGSSFHLASVHSQDEMELIFSLINDSKSHMPHEDHFHHKVFNGDSVWLGMTKFCPEDSTGKWTDGSKVNYSLLVTAHSENQSGNCIAYYISKQQPSWHLKNCNILLPYLCKYPLHDSIKKEYADYTDPCGDWHWCTYKDNCYKVETTAKVWFDARISCQNYGGDLLSVHSEKELVYLLKNFLKDWDDDEQFWTGLNKYESMDERFRWSDSTPLDYAPLTKIEFKQWRTSSCFSLNAKNYASVLKTDGRLWSLNRCDERHKSICWKPLNATYSTVQYVNSTGKIDNTVGYCKAGWKKYANKCYKTFGVNNDKEKATFIQAYNTCYSDGAHLASVRDVFENYFLMSILRGTGTSWIGLVQALGKIRWLDETKLDFVNFDATSLALFSLTNGPKNGPLSQRCFYLSIDKMPGWWEPVRSINSDLSSLMGRQQLTTVRTTKDLLSSLLNSHMISHGRIKRFQDYSNWRQQLPVGLSCDTTKMSFVCEQAVTSKKPSEETTDILTTVCPNTTLSVKGLSKVYSFGNSCYEFVFERKSWKQAEVTCGSSGQFFLSSHLLSISSLHELAFVTSTANLLDEFDKFWIGLSDSESTGLFKWSDGSPETFSRWGKGQPRSDRLNNCVQASLDRNRGSDWSTEDCEKTAFYICKRTNESTSKADVIDGTCHSGWFAASSQCFKIVSDDWSSGSNAVLKCWREYNATLASFTEKADVDRLVKRNEILYAKRRFFIGLIQKLHGQYEWLSGHAVTFVNWAPGEPRFAWNSNVEVCVEMDHLGLWYDVGCYEVRHFICSTPKIATKNSNLSLNKGTATSTITDSKNTTTYGKIVTSSPVTLIPVDKNDSYRIENNNSSTDDEVTVKTTVEFSQHLKSYSNSQSTEKRNSSSTTLGLTLCVLFLVICFSFLACLMYKRRVKLLHRLRGLFRPSGGTSSMRFEMLDEADDI